MPVFQPLEPQVVPDIGSTPQVHTGAEAIAQGVSNLGAGLNDAAFGLTRLAAIQTQKEEYQTSVNTDDFKAKQNAAFQQQLQNAPASGDGFAKSTLDNYDKAAAQYLTTVPESQRQRAQNDIMLHRDALAEQAAGKEHEIGNAYVLGTLKDSYNASREAVTLHPDTRDTVQQGLFQRIDKAYYLEPAQKVELKRDYINGLSFQQVKGIAPDNPAKVRELQGMPVTTGQSTSTSAPGDYLSKIRQHESGGNDSADNGTAVGRYQFTSGTWASVAKSHPDLGLTPAGRTDPAQQEKAIRAFTADNQATLQSAGIAPTNANTYMAHFLGSGGAIKFINAMQQDPNQSAAAIFGKEAANNKGVFYDRHTGGALSLGQVYDIQTRMFGGSAQSMPRVPTGGPAAAGAHPQAGDVTGSTQQQSSGPDPRFSSLTPEQWDQLHESAQRTQIQQNTAANTAATQAQKALVDSLQTDIINGKAGVSDVKPYLDRQQITPDQYLQLQGQVEKRDSDSGSAADFWSAASNGQSLNPYSEKDKKSADAAFKQAGGDVAALDKVYSASGNSILPASGVAALRGGLVSTNPQVVGQALTIAANAITRNPNAFTGAEGGGDIEKQALTYQHYVNDLQMPAAQAAQKIAQQNTPEYKSKLPPDTQVEDFSKSITPDTIAKQFSGWLPGSTPKFGSSPDQQSEMLRDYKEAALDAYKSNGGDAALAQQQAYASVNKVWGVTNVLGTQSLVKYPIEKTYPPVNEDPSGPYSYITAQAGKMLRDQAGQLVLPQNMIIAPIPNVTAQAYLKGDHAPYMLGYQAPDENGFMQVHMLPSTFTPNPEDAHRQATQFIQPQIDQMNQRDLQKQQDLQTEQNFQQQRYNTMNPSEAAPNRREWPGPPGIKAAPPAPAAGAPPSSGSDAFQQQKKAFEEGPGQAFFGSSGVGM